MLDYMVKTVPPEGLDSIHFENWESITELETDVFAMMANKATTLKSLSISYM